MPPELAAALASDSDADSALTAPSLERPGLAAPPPSSKSVSNQVSTGNGEYNTAVDTGDWADSEKIPAAGAGQGKSFRHGAGSGEHNTAVDTGDWADADAVPFTWPAPSEGASGDDDDIARSAAAASAGLAESGASGTEISSDSSSGEGSGDDDCSGGATQWPGRRGSGGGSGAGDAPTLRQSRRRGSHAGSQAASEREDDGFPFAHSSELPGGRGTHHRWGWPGAVGRRNVRASAHNRPTRMATSGLMCAHSRNIQIVVPAAAVCSSAVPAWHCNDGSRRPATCGLRVATQAGASAQRCRTRPVTGQGHARLQAHGLSRRPRRLRLGR